MSEDLLIYSALASRVLAVASINQDVGDWSAYIDAVPGMDHVKEYREVAMSGDKLPEHVAKAIFPRVAEEFDWRP